MGICGWISLYMTTSAALLDALYQIARSVRDASHDSSSKERFHNGRTCWKCTGGILCRCSRSCAKQCIPLGLPCPATTQPTPSLFHIHIHSPSLLQSLPNPPSVTPVLKSLSLMTSSEYLSSLYMRWCHAVAHAEANTFAI